MTDRPILFSAPMVRALLNGTKTQTRRILKPQPTDFQGAKVPPAGKSWVNKKRDAPFFAQHHDLVHWCWWDEYLDQGPDWIKVRFAKGDRLWSRETWAPLDRLTHNDPGALALSERGFYRADDGTVDGEISRWTPSIFMPRHASRLTLTVTDVRVERLQDISDADAIAEGIEAAPPEFPGMYLTPRGMATPMAAYMRLWDGINGVGSHQANPFVTAYTFTVHRHNIDRGWTP